MKLVVIVDSVVACGGGFNQSLSALLQLAKICLGKYELHVVSTHRENLEPIKNLGLSVEWVPIRFADRLLARLALFGWWSYIQTRIKYVSPFEKTLIKRGADICYFLSPSHLPLSLQILNYVVTVWDLCHQSFPEFPEVREYGEFRSREQLYEALIPAAYAVVADSGELSAQIISRYGVAASRVVCMPFSPSPFIGGCEGGDSNQAKSLSGEVGFYFYPAQYWAHKNHVRILEALAYLKAKGISRRFVFCGGDKGQRAYLEKVALSLQIADLVTFKGFVDNSELVDLYRRCKAVVMPTYFGPTNLPPLEAWSHGKPLIYSRHLSEQVGDGAILVDSDSVEELSLALERIEFPGIADDVARKGGVRLTQIDLMRQDGEQILADLLQKYSHRCRCWENCR